MHNIFKLNYMESASLALATIFTGIMAGFFWTYSYNVNIAMLQVDGKTYATMQSLFNQNVRHWLFFMFFFGAGVTSCFAVLLNIKRRKSVYFWFIVLAAVAYIIGIVVVTKQINLPLNYYTESWDILNLPDDWREVRDNWNHANDIRVIASCLSFFLCVVSLVLRSHDMSEAK